MDVTDLGMTSVEKTSDIGICRCGDICTCNCVSPAESTEIDIKCKPKPKFKKVDAKKAKAILKKPSAFSGQNVYDHLVEVIKRVIDERPINVADYFENFSRNVRCGKFRDSEWLASEVYRDPQFLCIAMGIIDVLKLPFEEEAEGSELEEEKQDAVEEEQSFHNSMQSEAPISRIRLGASQSENVLNILHLWSLCGLGFQIDEMFQLSLAICKLQGGRGVESARFWGRMYGIRKSYYIAEVTLTRSEIRNRNEALSLDVLDRMIECLTKNIKAKKAKCEHPCLLPGYFWQFLPEESENTKKMQPPAAPVPCCTILEKYEMPPEPIGSGLNRRTYFVMTSYDEDWMELPVVTPRQMRISRTIRKYFTGFLDNPVLTYPAFPGNEKHYLRTIIARITAGTYIAPAGYYRKMTKFERSLLAGELPLDGEGEMEDEEEEDEYLDNDCPIIENSFYEPPSTKDLREPSFWDHIRPNILNQGRVLYIDEELVLRELEKKAIRRMKLLALYRRQGEEGFEEEEDEEMLLEQRYGEEGEEEEVREEPPRPLPEVGPELFNPCSEDTNIEKVKPWTSRISSMYDVNNRMVLMRSNLWPGAFSFTHEKYCDSLYMGWGVKYVSRSMTVADLPPINDCGQPDDHYEATDPTPEMEEIWRRYYMKKEMPLPSEEISLISVDFDVDDEESKETI